MSEFDLRIPVCNWLIARGLSPICEVASLRNCDLVGIRSALKPARITELVAIELKLTAVAAVLAQCESHIGWPVNETWAAMLPAPARKHFQRFADKGIGMLAVDGQIVSVISPAKRFDDADLGRWKNLRRRQDEHKWRMKHPQMLRFPAMRMLREENERRAHGEVA